jgi:hypothetical protein
VSKYLTVATLLAITLNCPARADQPGKSGKPLSLADLCAWRQANEKSLADARTSGNPLALPAVQKQIEDDIKRWAGQPVEGKATIVEFALGKDGSVSLFLSGPKDPKGPASVIFLAKVADPKDPLLPKLRVGQEIVVKGTFVKREGTVEFGWGLDNVKVTLP